MFEIPEREGGDITASDMIVDDESSEIVDFYTNSTIFLTGATGFIGKMCLEKLLRDCYDLKKIFVLVRAKKGKDVQTRFEEIFDGPNMEPLKRKRPNYADKIVLISGDCSLPNLGLSHEDQQKLINETNCILHCAATVRFDEKIRTATNINVKAVMDLLQMAKQMKNLKSMIYVSTAYSNCIRKEIKETFYTPPISGRKLISLLDSLDDEKLDKITPILLGDYPNTYVYTKAVAEDVIKTEGKTLPLAVIRPSIVIASVKEPVAGWIDNLYGATGVLVGAALGVLRSVEGHKENIADLVPADFVVNCTLAISWDIARIKTINENKEMNESKTNLEEVPIYNYVSSPESKISWDGYTSLAEYHCKQIPSPLCVWYSFFAIRSSRINHLIATFFLHTLPAYIVDGIAFCIGKKPMMVKGYQKINKFADVIGYFILREWFFTNQNVQNLWLKLNKKDREVFEFSMKNFNWDLYFYTYVRGARLYLLKDPLTTIKEGTIKYYKLMIAHYTLLAVLAFILYKLLMWIYGFIF